MRRSILRHGFSSTTLALLLGGASLLAQTPAPCSLLKQGEIQTALGKPVEAGKPNAQNPKTICEFKVGTMGMTSILAKPLGPGETPDVIKAALQKGKIAVAEVANMGERAFYASPGMGMVQLNAFKKGQYLIVTAMVPGMAEPALKEAARKLMLIALSRL